MGAQAPDVTASERGISAHKGFSGGKGQAEEKEQLALREAQAGRLASQPVAALVFPALLSIRTVD